MVPDVELKKPPVDVLENPETRPHQKTFQITDAIINFVAPTIRWQDLRDIYYLSKASPYDKARTAWLFVRIVICYGFY